MPFNQLEKEQLIECVNSIEVHFCSDSSLAQVIDYENPLLYIIRTGEFEIRDPEGKLIDRLAEGDQFGYPALLSGKKILNRVSVLKEGLIYRLNAESFRWLKHQNNEFDIFYTEAYADRIKRTQPAPNLSLVQPIGNVIARRPVTIEVTETIQQAARVMTEREVSSIMVLQDEKLVGIVTDRDLRSRVIAQGCDVTKPLDTVMTPEPNRVLETESSESVLAKMLELHIHHLPVINQQQQLVGMVTTSDLIQMQISHPVYLIGRIKKANRLEQLVLFSKEIGNLLHQMISNNIRVEEIGRIISQISDELTVRLVKLAERELGKPPMKYCWVAFGSQGRSEQSANSDQDNGLILERNPSTEERAFFQALAQKVNYGLDACGFILCPGDVMAMNDKWLASLEQWQSYFGKWIQSPEPKALMHSNIFFDLRAIYGDSHLVQLLQESILKLAQGNSIFLAQLTQNALKTRVPLGFFKAFVLEQNGEHVPSLDLKHKALAPIADIARIYALATQSFEVNTIARISNVPSKLFNEQDAKALLDAYRFISRMRYQHQLRCWQKGKKVDNFVIPSDLSSLQRAQLKDAFQVIDDAQSGIKMKFSRGLI